MSPDGHSTISQFGEDVDTKPLLKQQLPDKVERSSFNYSPLLALVVFWGSKLARLNHLKILHAVDHRRFPLPKALAHFQSLFLSSSPWSVSAAEEKWWLATFSIIHPHVLKLCCEWGPLQRVHSNAGGAIQARQFSQPLRRARLTRCSPNIVPVVRHLCSSFPCRRTWCSSRTRSRSCRCGDRRPERTRQGHLQQ